MMEAVSSCCEVGHAAHRCASPHLVAAEFNICRNSKKLKNRFRFVFAGFPSFLDCGVGGWSYCNLLASTVECQALRSPKALLGCLQNVEPPDSGVYYSSA